MKRLDGSFTVLFIAVGIAIGGTIAVPLTAYMTGSHILTFEVNAQIGDFIGGILNPVIALIALLWLVKGVRIQQRELQETKLALQASERHQSAQVRISAITALIASINDEYNKLRAYRKSLEPELDLRLKSHEDDQAMAGPMEILSFDEETSALVDEMEVLGKSIVNLENRKLGHLSELREILEGTDGSLHSME